MLGIFGELLLRQAPSQLWVHVPPTAIGVITLGQLVQAHRQREEAWTARRWTAAAVLVVGMAGFALACWWDFFVLGTVVVFVSCLAFVLLNRRPGTRKRPRSPEGEQGRSEP